MQANESVWTKVQLEMNIPRAPFDTFNLTSRNSGFPDAAHTPIQLGIPLYTYDRLHLYSIDARSHRGTLAQGL